MRDRRPSSVDPGRAAFVLSLDMEMGWGFARPDAGRAPAPLWAGPSVLRQAVEGLLATLERRSLPATWAVVGHLCLDAAGARELVHPRLPQFSEGWLDWERYRAISADPLYCARDAVEGVLASAVGHEIGLHSFCHIPFSRCRREVAAAEVKLGLRAMESLGVRPRSFVFPYDDVACTDVLQQEGFTVYRGRERGKCSRWGHSPAVRRYNKLVDRLVALPVAPSFENGMWRLPCSMRFTAGRRLRPELAARASRGVDEAIRSGRAFHVRLHPWNLVDRGLSQALADLLDFVAARRDEGRLDVKTMGQLVPADTRA